jgi:hypothetical protein
MSTTPRTDEQVFDWTTEDGSDIVFASFARELETELAAMTARAEKAEADTARLDWLDAHALPQHSPNISISDLGRHFNGFPGSFRAAIDAAMKEASK